MYHAHMETEHWPPEWQRGVLELIVLAAMDAEGQPTYGYRIIQRLEAAGFGRIKGGTLYPILSRLEEAGYVRSWWGEGEGGPGRKFVDLTSAGRSRVSEHAAQWHAFQRAVGRLVTTAKQGV